MTFTSDVTTDATGSFDDGGTGLTDFVLTNTSGRACQVGGWVGFTLRGDATVDACVAGQPPTDPPCGGVVDQDTALDQDIRRADGDTSPVVLDPGASTSFRATSSDATLCLERPYRVELVLAVGDEPIYVVLTDSVLCAARPVLLTPLAAT